MKNELLAGKISRINDEELGSCVGGRMDGIVNFLGEKLGSYIVNKSESIEYSENKEKLLTTIYINSDKIVEGILAMILIGGTLGISKLKNYFKKDKT